MQKRIINYFSIYGFLLKHEQNLQQGMLERLDRLALVLREKLLDAAVSIS